MSIFVLAVIGPTASGKTALGVELARAYNGEVVSCDSMQIYKGMSIATAKPTVEEMKGVPHHLLHFVESGQRYSVAQFVQDAHAVIADIHARGKCPVLVGGTGLYVSSLLEGIRFSEESQDPAVRTALQQQAQQLGKEAMHQLLQEIDPDYAKTLHPNNLGRVLRAIELYRATGKTMTWQLAESKKLASPYTPLMIGIDFKNRSTLYNRINQRVDAMLEHGLLAEARDFLALPDSKTAKQAIGVKELDGYFRGQEQLETAVERIKQETRRYAKRQLTWFRRDQTVHWLFADAPERKTLLEQAIAIVEKEGLLH